MQDNSYAQLLEAHGVKPTANRIIIVKALSQAGAPMSMKELEYSILSLDKSSIFRTLTLFRDHHLVHTIESGDGGVRYELCKSHDNNIDDDEHVHFYCEQCHKTYCLYDTLIPQVPVPEGFLPNSANYILRGICPHCRK
ncbi:MAG: transcriptional repressor [Prevotella sp.]|nr:transcriptional repressor [Prevotella sp.]